MSHNKSPLVRLEAWVLRAPHERPVRTSFGVMRDRPALLVRVEDRDGGFGWGEIWCNWPSCGAEHRLRLIEEDVASALFAMPADAPLAISESLRSRFSIKALQTGEPGPYAQTLAGIDIALCDLHARRAALPLYRWLAPRDVSRIPAYASGIHVDDAEIVISASREAGFRAFKLKVGFHRDRDIAGLIAAKTSLGPNECLMADANQGWTREEASYFLDAVADLDLAWVEEPLRADAPWAIWEELAEGRRTALAGGENIMGLDGFDAAIASGALRIVQPDVAKWGGVTGCVEVARRTLAAGLRYCPHFLGAGIGLAASAHLLAASGGDGLLEIDVNPNPLRSDLVSGWPVITDGFATMPSGPGLGVRPDTTILDRFATLHIDLRA